MFKITEYMIQKKLASKFEIRKSETFVEYQNYLNWEKFLYKKKLWKWKMFIGNK